MLKQSQRIWISVGSVILSLPAFFAVYAGFFFTYATAVLAGYNGTQLQAIVKLLSSSKGLLATTPWLLIIVHIGLFISLLIRFARGLPLPVFAQLYCLATVIFAIGVRIQIVLTGGNAFFWFGLFSLPHVICLLGVLYFNNKSTRPYRTVVRTETSESAPSPSPGL
jgi:hypothetical protein